MICGLLASGGAAAGIEIEYLGFSNNPMITRWGPGRREQYILHYVLEGKGYYNGSVVNAGQGFLIKPGMLQEYYPDINDPWHFFWIAFKGEYAENLIPYLNADSKTLIYKFSFIKKFLLLEEKISLRSEETASQFELMEIFMNFFKYHIRDNETSVKVTDSYVNFAKNYIETNFGRKITIDEISGKLGISNTYLYKLFCSKQGRSPKQYLTEYRIHQAKTLLESTQMSVTAIAQAVGFDDPLNFSKFFSKYEGCSPSRYRDKKEPKKA